MKYFRYYPWALQLFLFVMLVAITFGLISSLLYVLVPGLTGFRLEQIAGINEKSSPALVHLAMLCQGVLNAAIFLLPAAAFAYAAHPRPISYLGLKAPAKKIHLLLAVLIVLGAMPILEAIAGLIGMIDFGKSIKADQAANDALVNAFLNMPTFADFLRALVVIAVLPAIGEELFFRSILMRFTRKKTPSMVTPILFTALVFSLSHTNIYGYLSIFLAGVLLAAIYNLTGSLWCSIIAHFFFNGSQVVWNYLTRGNKALTATLESNAVTWTLVAGGAIIFGVSFYFLWKTRTPLPPTWTDDFTPEEIATEASESQ